MHACSYMYCQMRCILMYLPCWVVGATWCERCAASRRTRCTWATRRTTATSSSCPTRARPVVSHCCCCCCCCCCCLRVLGGWRSRWWFRRVRGWVAAARVALARPRRADRARTPRWSRWDAHAQYPREPHVQFGEYERIVGELGEAARRLSTPFLVLASIAINARSKRKTRTRRRKKKREREKSTSISFNLWAFFCSVSFQITNRKRGRIRTTPTKTCKLKFSRTTKTTTKNYYIVVV